MTDIYFIVTLNKLHWTKQNCTYNFSEKLNRKRGIVCSFEDCSKLLIYRNPLKQFEAIELKPIFHVFLNLWKLFRGTKQVQ